MKLSLSIAFMLCLFHSSLLGQAITFATYNCYFLFDGNSPEYNADFNRKGNPALAREHIRDIANQLRRINADIVNLVEVENEEVLQVLVEELKGMGYAWYFVQGGDIATGQNVALLSKIEPLNLEVKRYPNLGVNNDGTAKSVSKNYYALFDFNDVKVAIIGAHLLAFPDMQDRKSEREAQAFALCKLSDSLSKLGYHSIIMGDFNDYDEDIQDAANSVSITETLKILKSGEYPLFNTLKLVAGQSERYTSEFDNNKDGKISVNERHVIDHILIDQRLLSFVDSVLIPKEYNLGSHLTSDHYPVVAYLNFSSDRAILSMNNLEFNLNAVEELIDYIGTLSLYQDMGFDYLDNVIYETGKSNFIAIDSNTLDPIQVLHKVDYNAKVKPNVWNEIIRGVSKFETVSKRLGSNSPWCNYVDLLREYNYTVRYDRPDELVIATKQLGQEYRSGWPLKRTINRKYEIIAIEKEGTNEIVISTYYAIISNLRYYLEVEPRDRGMHSRQIITLISNLICNE